MAARAAITFCASLLLFVTPAPALTLAEGSAWNAMPISVCFEEFSPAYKQDRAQIRQVVEQSWAKESAVAFEGWRACREDEDGIRIRLSDDHPKTRARGRHLNGLVEGMNLPKLWGLASLSVNAKSAVHEFGHALGFGHEYARADAPYQDSCAVTRADGERYVEPDLAITAFDFDSIMVACLKGATRSFSIGVPRLSAGDIYGLIKTYGSAPDNILDADEAGDRFGHSLAVADFNGDAIPDLAVGAPGEKMADTDLSTGAVYLYRGDAVRGLRPWARLTREGTAAFGTVLHAGQFSADKRSDLIVGAADGAMSLYTGRSHKPPILSNDIPDRPPAAAVAFEGAGPLDGAIEPFDIEPGPNDIDFGHTWTLADLDADGHDDLIVTAPSALVDGAPSGQVFVYRSPHTDRPWVRTPSTFTPWYRFGQAY